MILAIIVLAVCVYAIFSPKVDTDILMKHLLAFAAMGACAYIGNPNVKSIIFTLFFVYASSIYYIMLEYMKFLEDECQW